MKTEIQITYGLLFSDYSFLKIDQLDVLYVWNIRENYRIAEYY